MATRAAVSFKSNLSFNAQAEKLFSKSEWQRAMKASLITAGRDWIALALPKRFSSFAKTDLGYDSKKMHKTLTREDKIRLAITMMRTNGQYDRIVQKATAQWGGWDPTGKAPLADDIWRRWAADALKSGKIKVSNSGEWKTARQKMRKEVIEQSRMKEKVRNFAIDEYVDQDAVLDPIPLVETGALEKYALANARPDAKTKGGTSELTIRIPRQHPLRPKHGAVLGRTTPEEADRVASVFTGQMEAFIAGSSVVVKGKKKPKTTLRASKQQRRDIDRTIRGAMTKGARSRAHKSRTTKHTPRG